MFWMSDSTRNGRRVHPAASVVLLLFSGLTGCGSDREVAGPGVPIEPPREVGSALAIHLDLVAETAVVEESAAPAPSAAGVSRPSFALLGRNEVGASVASLGRSAVGEFVPNKVRVTLDLTLENKLQNADLVPSTFPAPPAGVSQVLAFPFATSPAGLFGTKVKPSTDWDGVPHNFFNDALCLGLPAPPADCFRYEPYGARLDAGGKAVRRVGFDVDPSVTTFTVYVVVAADVAERAIQTLALSRSSVAMTAGLGGQPANEDVTVSSESGMPVTGLAVNVAVVESSEWLSASLSVSTTPATVTISASPDGLQPGLYLGVVTITGAAAGPVTIGVRFQVMLLPDLTFTGTPGVEVGAGSVAVTDLVVVNQGLSAAGPYNVGICLSSSDAQIDCVSGLQAGFTRPGLAESYTDPLGRLQIAADPGTYQLLAIVDPTFSAMVIESDETNNVLVLGSVQVP